MKAATKPGTAPPIAVVDTTARRNRDNEVVTESDGRFRVSTVVNNPRDTAANMKPNVCRCEEIEDAKYVAVLCERTLRE